MEAGYCSTSKPPFHLFSCMVMMANQMQDFHDACMTLFEMPISSFVTSYIIYKNRMPLTHNGVTIQYNTIQYHAEEIISKRHRS